MAIKIEDRIVKFCKIKLESHLPWKQKGTLAIHSLAQRGRGLRRIEKSLSSCRENASPPRLLDSSFGLNRAAWQFDMTI